MKNLTLNRIISTISLFFLLALVLPANVNSQTTVNIGSMKDNTLYEDVSGSLSNGSGNYFFCGKTVTDLKRRGLIAFDIAGSIPACATITSVTLTLHMSRTISGNHIAELRKVKENWGEGASVAVGEEGIGIQAEGGDATWVYAYYDTVYWGRDGGIFSDSASASASIGGVAFYTWGSTSRMVNDVQSWLDDPSANFGWLLFGNENAAGSAKRFDTKENPTASFQPKLSVTYVLNSQALNLTSMIEGFWDGTTMVPDYAEVFLRNAVSPYGKIDSATSILNQSGNAMFCFDNAPNGSYFIEVTHRNSIQTWSKLPQAFSIGVLKNYNFTTASTQAFGNNLILKDGKYCNYSGDVNQDGVVDGSDTQLIDNDAYNFVSGYVNTDVNGDDIVDGSDLALAGNNADNFVGAVIP